MQISKCLLTVCAAVSVLSVRAADNQAQIKAREALEKAMNQPGQPSQAAPPPAVTQAPPTVPQVVTPAPADSDAIARARQALEQKLNETQSQPAVSAPEPAPKVIPPPPAPKRRPKPQMAAQPPMTVEAPAAPALNSVPAADPEAIAKAREALREKMQSLGGEPAPTPPAPAFAQPPPAAPPVAVVPAQPSSTPAFSSMPEPDSSEVAKAREAMRTTLDAIPPAAGPETAGKSGLNFPALQAPPLGISAEKQQKLQNLLQQYKLDLISPEQYQASRAKILAGQ